jgi:hypothetical protein
MEERYSTSLPSHGMPRCAPTSILPLRHGPLLSGRRVGTSIPQAHFTVSTCSGDLMPGRSKGDADNLFGVPAQGQQVSPRLRIPEFGGFGGSRSGVYSLNVPVAALHTRYKKRQERYKFNGEDL